MINLFPYTKLEAGNTYNWTIELPEYSDSTLSYILKRIGSLPIAVLATKVDSIFTAKLTTTGLPEGPYQVNAYMTASNGERSTIGSTTITVMPNLTTQGINYDNRSYNKICLDAIEQTLKGTCANGYLETVFKDTTFKYRSTGELVKLRNHFQQLVNAENGLKDGRVVIKWL